MARIHICRRKGILFIKFFQKMKTRKNQGFNVVKYDFLGTTTEQAVS